MSQESNGGGCSSWIALWCWVGPWMWAGEKGGISGDEVGLIFLWYGFLILLGWLASRNR